MAKFIGRQQDVGIARETTRGALVAPTFWVPKTNFNVEDKAQKARFQGNYGVLAGGDDALVAQKWAEGDLQFEAQDKIMGLIFYALFGTVSSASFNSAFKHTASLANSVQHTTLALFMNDPIGSGETPTKSVAYAMSMINSLELAVELGELVKCNVNFIAKPHTDYTRQTASYASQSLNKFAHHHLRFKVAANEASLDAASKINLQSLTLRIEKNVVRENALGTVHPVDILNRMFKISATVKLTYEDRTYRDYMMNGTKKAVRIQLVNPDVTIGSTNPQLQIDLPICDFEQWEPDVKLEDIAMQEILINALYDVTNSQLIGANTFVVNNTTSY